MSFHYLQGQVEVSSEAIYWDGEQFVPSNMPSFLGKYCLLDNEMVSCHDFPYGMTSEHLMEIFGVVVLMSSAVASPAKTSVQQVKGLGLQGKDRAYGPKWRGLSVKLGPHGCWLKTHHSSHPEDLTPFCETWPRWGMMRSGECWEQLTPERPTKESVSGSWPTPRSCSAMSARFTVNTCLAKFPNLETVVARREAFPVGKYLNPDWVELLMGWPKGWTSVHVSLTEEEFNRWLLGFTEDTVAAYGKTAWKQGSWEHSCSRTIISPMNQLARLKAIGNGQVPAVAALAFSCLSRRIAV